MSLTREGICGSMTESSQQRKWVREEVVILVTEYFRTKNLSPKEIEENHQRISDFLRKREKSLTVTPISDVFRNYAGIRLQSERIRCLDPETHYTGMQGTKLQRKIVQEYLDDPDKMIEEAEAIYDKYQ